MTQVRKTYAMRPLDWALLLLLSTFWGGAYIFGKVAIEELRPFTLVFARTALAALILHAVVLFSGQRMPRSWTIWRQLFILGAINSLIPFSLISWAQIEIASSLAAILTAITPLWTALLANFLTRDEKLTANRLAGVLLGFTGVVIVIGLDAFGSLTTNLLSQLAVVLAALAYAAGSIYGKRFHGLPPFVTAAGQITATAVLALPLMLLIDKPWQIAGLRVQTIASVLSLAIVGTALAYIIFFRLLATAGANNIVLVTFLIPVSALLMGALLLGERLAARQIVGMLVIALGMVAIDGRLWRRYMRARTPAAEPAPPG